MNSLGIQRVDTRLSPAPFFESGSPGSAGVSPANPSPRAPRTQTPFADAIISAKFSPEPLLTTPPRIARLFSAPIFSALWVYRVFCSAPLQVIAGPTCGCRFYPTCSQYAVAAVEVHGPIRGLWLASKRLLKCTPLHAGGVDLVPAKSERRPSCSRLNFHRFIS